MVGVLALCGVDDFWVAWSGANDAVACVVGVLALCGVDDFWVAWSGANVAKDAVACVVGFVELCGADEFCVAWSGANVTKYAIACVVGVVELCGADEFLGGVEWRKPGKGCRRGALDLNILQLQSRHVVFRPKFRQFVSIGSGSIVPC